MQNAAATGCLSKVLTPIYFLLARCNGIPLSRRRHHRGHQPRALPGRVRLGHPRGDVRRHARRGLRAHRRVQAPPPRNERVPPAAQRAGEAHAGEPADRGGRTLWAVVRLHSGLRESFRSKPFGPSGFVRVQDLRREGVPAGDGLGRGHARRGRRRAAPLLLARRQPRGPALCERRPRRRKGRARLGRGGRVRVGVPPDRLAPPRQHPRRHGRPEGPEGRRPKVARRPPDLSRLPVAAEPRALRRAHWRDDPATTATSRSGKRIVLQLLRPPPAQDDPAVPDGPLRVVARADGGLGRRGERRPAGRLLRALFAAVERGHLPALYRRRRDAPDRRKHVVARHFSIAALRRLRGPGLHRDDDQRPRHPAPVPRARQGRRGRPHCESWAHRLPPLLRAAAARGALGHTQVDANGRGPSPARPTSRAA